MSNPRDFPKSVSVLYSISTSLYIASAVVIYCYGGSHIESPALGSAGPLMKKVVYGLALPTVCRLIFLYGTHLSLIYIWQIIVSGVVVGHVACKTVYVRIFRGSDHIHESSLMSLGVLVWVIIALVIWIISWVIAMSIPVFNNLLSLIVCFLPYPVCLCTFGIANQCYLHLQTALFGGWFSCKQEAQFPNLLYTY